MNNLEIINFFLHNIVKWLRVLIEKEKFFKFFLNVSFLANFNYVVTCPCRTDRYKDTNFAEITIFIVLVTVKAALHKNLTQTVDSSELFEEEFSKNN